MVYQAYVRPDSLPENLSREVTMYVVLNNPALYVMDFPSVGAIEVIDKRRARGGLLAGEAALRFRRELADMMSQGDDPDEVEFCLDDYDDLLTQPAIYQ